MNFTQIKETCLYTEQLDRAEEFYEQKLGLSKIAKAPGRHVFFRAGSSVLLVFNPKVTAMEDRLPPHDGYGRLHMAFEVPKEEYDAAKADIMNKGITIAHEEHWRNGFRSFYFHDPDGHVLEIIEAGFWEKGF